MTAGLPLPKLGLEALPGSRAAVQSCCGISWPVASGIRGSGRNAGVLNAAGIHIVGRYRLEKLLGRGGMGEVWRAHDARLDRHVAIKFLSTHTAVDGELLDRFRREARVTARLQHPGITQVFDSGAQDGQLHLVMELLEGRDLRAVLRARESPLPVDQAVDLAAQVADALSYAHQADIVHRDIKPANLMLVAGGRVKVCDFGLAGFVRADSDLTREGDLMGTPAYMAPEQCLGQRVDGRADLYALGCVLFALLTGSPPFSAYGDYRAVMLAHLHTPPPPLASRRPGLPDALQQLVSALLGKDPQRGLGTPGPSRTNSGAWDDPGPAVRPSDPGQARCRPPHTSRRSEPNPGGLPRRPPQGSASRCSRTSTCRRTPPRPTPS